jgi:hypothetical protein
MMEDRKFFQEVYIASIVVIALSFVAIAIGFIKFNIMFYQTAMILVNKVG